MQNNHFTTVNVEFCGTGFKSISIDGHDITNAVEHVSLSARPNSRSSVVIELEPDVLKVSADPYLARLVHRVIVDEPERFTLWQRMRAAFQAAKESMKAQL